jgi:ABC-2 type transport system ATP-binding protein
VALIEMKNINKEFQVHKREKGFINGVKSLIHRKYETVRAVSDMNFNIERGELVGYIGQNGAGKSTTIKMLSGILVPTSGEVTVNGITPHKNRRENAMHIGVVFGQRSQLNWDLPMEDTFDLYRKMYKVSYENYKRNVDFFVELLGMQDFLRKPVRQLSLGQKMRAEIAISLLHDPDILYLDEPTIGLDVLVKEKIRSFIRELNAEKKTTVILTTHDMTDIDTICDRIIMIDKGKKLIDEPLEKFKGKYNNEYLLEVEFVDVPQVIDSRLTPKVIKGNRITYLCSKKDLSTKQALTYIINNFDVEDVSVKMVDIDEIVRTLYKTV